VTLDICSFITALHGVTNRGMEGKERVTISYGFFFLIEIIVRYFKLLLRC